MKKIVLLFLCLFFAGGYALAQTEEGKAMADKIGRWVENQPQDDLQGPAYDALVREITEYAKSLGVAYPDDPDKVREGVFKKIETIRDRAGSSKVPGGGKSIIVRKWCRKLIQDLMKQTQVARFDTVPQLACTAFGLGQTTGEAIRLDVVNTSEASVFTVVEPCYIPQTRYQGYVVSNPVFIYVPANSQTTVYLYSDCTDITLPPIPEGMAAPSIQDWVFISDAPPVAEVFGTDQPWWRPAPDEMEYTLINPATQEPFTYVLDPVADTRVTASIFLHTIEQITMVYDSLEERGEITTPIGNDPVRQRQSTTAQTFWLVNGTTTGVNYKLDEFYIKTIENYEKSTGQDFTALETESRLEVEQDICQFWVTFEGIGEAAKLIRPVAGGYDDWPSVAYKFYQIYKAYREMGDSHEEAMEGTWASKAMREKWSERFRQRYEAEKRQ